jgi:hypothetical protein
MTTTFQCQQNGKFFICQAVPEVQQPVKQSVQKAVQPNKRFGISNNDNSLLPSDLLDTYGVGVQESYITFQRYQNTDVIWGRPKSVLCGYFAGAAEEQHAVGYPDQCTCYFVSWFILPTGYTLRLKSQYPHCRYFSFTIANQLANGNLGGGINIKDADIIPDPDGSVNPFLPGANRNIAKRNYTVDIVALDPPANPAPNTLYIGTNRTGLLHLALRIYLADQGWDGTGNVRLIGHGSGLPVASVIDTSGNVITGADVLTTLQVVKKKDPAYPLSNWTALVKASSDPTNAPILPTSQFRIFWNLAYNVNGAFLENNPALRLATYPVNSSGGFLNNPDNEYLSVGVSFSYGQVYVIRGRKPSTPTTVSGDTFLPTVRPQVQYFSVNVGGSPPSGQGWNGTYDERIPTDENGFFTIVVSWPWNRPANATLENGVVWLNPGAGEGYYVGARNHISVVYFRYLNPDPSWAQSPAYVPQPTTANPSAQEAMVMGDYYPKGQYMSKAYFEANYAQNDDFDDYHKFPGNQPDNDKFQGDRDYIDQ